MKTTIQLIALFIFSILGFSATAQEVADKEIKKNVTDISAPLEKLVQLEPKIFEYNTDKYKHLKLEQGKQFGFMSENMQQVFPELVSNKNISYMFGKNVYRDAKVKTVDELSLIPVLVASIKEQQKEIEKLKQDIAELKSVKSTANK